MSVPLVLAAALVLSAAPPKTFPFPTKVSTLKNGLTVVRVPFDSPGLVAYYTAVRVGSRNEIEEGHTGFAHFFEHMMFRGTKRFPEGARGKLLGSLGFNENAFTTDDFTLYTVNGPTSALDQLVDVEADRFMTLEYAEPAFQTEALAVAGEYQKNASSPGLKIEEALLGTAFTKHTYRHTTLGFWEDIQKMPQRYAYSKSFFERWYTPDNCAVIVVGDFDDAKLMATIEKAYAPWNRKAAKITVPVEPPQKEARVAKLVWPTATLPRLGLAWHVPAAGASIDDAALQEVLSNYLVGPTSTLHTSLVLEQQLAERVGSMTDPHRDPNLFGIDVRLKDEKHREAVRAAVLAELKNVQDGKIDAKRVDDIKSHLRYQLVMGLESPGDVAVLLGATIGTYGKVDAIDALFARIMKVTPKELSAFAKKHLVDSNRTTLEFTVEKGGQK